MPKVKLIEPYSRNLVDTSHEKTDFPFEEVDSEKSVHEKFEKQVLITPIDDYVRFTLTLAAPDNLTPITRTTLFRGTEGKVIFPVKICAIFYPMDQADFFTVDSVKWLYLYYDGRIIPNVNILMSTPFQTNWVTELITTPVFSSNRIDIYGTYWSNRIIQTRYLYIRYKGLVIPTDVFKDLTPTERMEICRKYLRS